MRTTIRETLNFSSPLVRAEILRDAHNELVLGRSVVVNMSGEDALVGDGRLCALPPFSSTILIDGQVSGSLIGVFTADEVPDQEALSRELSWLDFYGGDRAKPVLLRSPQDTVATITLDKAAVLHQAGLSPERFEVKANLWFSPQGTDCGIHNEHAFIEVHTQITGTGRMQKFAAKDHDSIYEDQILAPGATNPTPFCIEQDGGFAYPWHQYRADTDCIWLALEYHQA